MDGIVGRNQALLHNTHADQSLSEIELQANHFGMSSGAHHDLTRLIINQTETHKVITKCASDRLCQPREQRLRVKNCGRLLCDFVYKLQLLRARALAFESAGVLYRGGGLV